MLALVLTAVALGSAASAEGETALVGGRIGFDFSKPLNLDTSTRHERRTGAVLGVQVALPVSRHLWLRPEVSFARKEFTDWSDFARDMVPVGAPYLGLSVVPMVVTKLGWIRPYAGVAPEFSIRLSDSANYEDVALQLRQLDLGLLVAAGLSADVNQGLLVGLEVRYMRGLFNLDASTYYESDAYRMSTWQFTISMMWRVKR
jgi:opacity protein-like surface antigen